LYPKQNIGSELKLHLVLARCQANLDHRQGKG